MAQAQAAAYEARGTDGQTVTRPSLFGLGNATVAVGTRYSLWDVHQLGDNGRKYIGYMVGGQLVPVGDA